MDLEILQAAHKANNSLFYILTHSENVLLRKLCKEILSLLQEEYGKNENENNCSIDY